MTDERIDQDGETGDRRAEVDRERREALRRESAGVLLGRPRGVLTAEDAAARRAMRAEASALEVQAPAAAREVAAAKGALPADAGASLRAAQAGFALALVLALVWTWISFRRGGGGR